MREVDSHNLLARLTKLEDDELYRRYKHFISKKVYLQLEKKTAEAVNEQKTFAIVGRAVYVNIIRKALLDRGWVQKFADLEKGPTALAGKLQDAPDRISLITSQMMGNAKIKLLWFAAFYKMVWSPISSYTIVNKFPSYKEEPPFTSKVGLLKALERQHWTFGGNKDIWVKYPRTYNVSSLEELKEFANHYRVSACLAVIRIFMDWANMIDVSGTVPLETLDFALKRMCEYLAFKENADLDVWNITNVTFVEWEKFLKNFYDLAHNKCRFRPHADFKMKGLLKSCRSVLVNVVKTWPDVGLEGYCNMWIVKPGYSSRGRGVTVHKTLDSILAKCSSFKHFVIQKYMEKPLLIHDTKFDIRQWILITSVEPLTIWMYDEFYLRFCSRKFSLEDTHESVHLSNNCVQRKYQKELESEIRHPELPANNMWTCHQFKSYLIRREEVDGWNKLVSGIRGALIGTTLAAQESIRHRPNSFYLLGADFMVSTDFRPWLLEVNSSPAMGPTTSVTKAMCHDALVDVLKVVIDRSEDGNADTGKFRMIYRQRYAPDLGVKDMRVVGRKIRVFSDDNLLLRKRNRQQNNKESTEDDKSVTSWDERSVKYEKLFKLFHKNQLDLDLKEEARRSKNTRNAMPRMPGSVMDEADDSISLTMGNVDPDNTDAINKVLGEILNNLDRKSNKLSIDSINMQKILEMTPEELCEISK